LNLIVLFFYHFLLPQPTKKAVLSQGEPRDAVVNFDKAYVSNFTINQFRAESPRYFPEPPLHDERSCIL